jgi:hypothetical protein
VEARLLLLSTGWLSGVLATGGVTGGCGGRCTATAWVFSAAAAAPAGSTGVGMGGSRFRSMINDYILTSGEEKSKLYDQLT